MQPPPIPPGFRPVQPQGGQSRPIPLGTRQPAPRYDDEAEASRLRIDRLEQEIDAANRQPRQTDADNEDRRLQRITALRQEFNNRPDVREFNTVRGSVQNIRRLATSIPHGAPGRAQADIALVFSFMRALDPTSSVRETEYANAQNSAGVPEQIRNQYNRLLSGEFLSPEQRQGFLRTAMDTYMVRARTYNEVARQYQPLFQQHGEDPNRHIQIALGPDREDERNAGSAATANLPAPEGDIGFSGRDLQETLTNEQVLQYDRFIASQPRGQLQPQALEQFWQQLTGQRLQNAEEIASAYNEHGSFSSAANTVERNPTTEELFLQHQDLRGPGGTEDLIQQGATLGLSDEAGGVGNVIVNAVRAPFTDDTFDPVGSYVSGRDASRMRIEQARGRTGRPLATALEIGGGFGGVGGVNALRGIPATLGGRVAQGSRIGFGTGGLAGFGYGEGPMGSPVSALVGAIGGGAIGGGIPLAGAGGRSMADLVRTVGGRNPNLARRTVAQAITDDANTPRGVGQQMSEAEANGVPMMLADTGDNTRGLLAASSRAPGPGRTLARDALDERQAGLGERVGGAIERDLGPISNPNEVHDQLIQQARTAAAPLYEAAYARPGADTFARRIEGLMRRPAMQRALNRARAIAQEEGRDPNTLGFDVNAAGEVTTIRTPSWQTFDYLKRGLDDVLQAQPRDPRTGSIIMDEATRAIDQTRRGFLTQIDRANPDYAQARAAWAGPARAREAMDLGRRSLNMNADDLTARTREMGPSEQEFFRLGVRRAMAERISSLGDTANVTHALLGTGKRRALMLRLFGGRSSFNRFVQTLQQEQAGFQTYRTARQGSPTAVNVQDDAALSAATTVADIGTTGLPVTTMVRNMVQYGSSAASRKAQQEIAALLSERDPSRLRELARELNKEAARARAARGRQGRSSVRTGRAAGQGAAIAGSEFTN